MLNNKLQSDELGAIDREITQWGHQGFEDISSIIHDDNTFSKDSPTLGDDDLLHRRVKSMRVQGADLFVTVDTGEILHYRMTVTRL